MTPSEVLQEEGGPDSGCDEVTGVGHYEALPSSRQMDQEMQAVEAAVAAAELEGDDVLPSSYPPPGETPQHGT
jgi:hypothetical protein